MQGDCFLYVYTCPQLKPLEMKNLVGDSNNHYKLSLLLMNLTSFSREGGITTFSITTTHCMISLLLLYCCTCFQCIIGILYIVGLLPTSRCCLLFVEGKTKWYCGRFQDKFWSPFTHEEVGFVFHFMVLWSSDCERWVVIGSSNTAPHISLD